MLHGDEGPASRWAARAQPGLRVGFGGPRTDWRFDSRAAWHLLAGDETALPAIGAIVETLRASRAAVFVEVADAAEEQELVAGAGIDIRWVHRDGIPAGESRKLEQTIREADLPAGSVQAWVAGETLAVRKILEHLRQERGFPASTVKTTGYWRHHDTPTDL